MEIKETRYNNYLFLLDRFKQSVWADDPTVSEHGMLRKLAEQIGISPAYISHLNTRRKDIGSRTARRFESSLKLPAGWMDEAHDESTPVTADERTFMSTAIELYRMDPTAAQSALLQALAVKLRSTTK